MEYTYLYKWELKFLVKEEKIDFAPLRIKSLKIINDIDENILPIMEMELLVSKKDLYDLVQFQRKIVANIQLKLLKCDINNEQLGEYSTTLLGDKVETKIIMNETFIPMVDPSVQKRFFKVVGGEKTLEKKDIPLDEEEEFQSSSFSSEIVDITVSFFSLKGLNASKELFNMVLDEATVGDALGYLASNSTFDKFIIDKPDNEESYKNLILLPSNFKNSILNLQYRYGIYSTGLRTFFDFDVMYILNDLIKEHETVSGEKSYCKLNFRDIDVNPSVDTIITEDKGVVLYTTGIPPDYFDTKIGRSEIDGDMYMYTNYGFSMKSHVYKNEKVASYVSPGRSVDFGNATKHTLSGNKIAVDYDELNNEYNVFSRLNAMKVTKELFILTLDGVCTEDFKANKTIEVTFDNKERNTLFSGNYTWRTCIFEYTEINPTDANNIMVCNATLVFHKCIDSKSLVNSNTVQLQKTGTVEYIPVKNTTTTRNRLMVENFLKEPAPVTQMKNEAALSQEEKRMSLKVDIRNKFDKTKTALRKEGIDITVVYAGRAQATQKALFAQGRGTVDEVNELRRRAGMGPINESGNYIVTQTMNSKHLKNEAIDLCPLKNGKEWWTAPTSIWNRIGALGEKNGLIWGGSWKDFKDPPHLQDGV